MTTISPQPHSSELHLDDLDFIEKEIAEPTSLPAALVDDQLMQEMSAIPDKLAFKIGDVAEMLQIKQYVLRYWESEFEILKPKKASNNQRMYTRKDVENALIIRKLLHRDRFSIEGARQVFRDFKQVVRKEKTNTQVHTKLHSVSERLGVIAQELHQIKLLFK